MLELKSSGGFKMKIKKIAKLSSIALLGGMLLTSGWFVGKTAWRSHGTHKKEKAWWAENGFQYYRDKGKQFYHPSKLKAVRDLAKDGNMDLYVYEPTFKTRFLFDLGCELNAKFGTELTWGYKRITTDKAIDQDPAYSPDGKYLAFASDRCGSFDIWIMDEEGKNKFRITNDDLGNETRPKWLDDKTLKYHYSKEGKSFYETRDLESSKILERVVVDRGGFVGDRAFNFTLKDLDGKQYTLDDYVGKVVILNFWSIWCGPCREEIPSLEEFYKNKPENVELISLISAYDKKNQVEEFVKEKGITYPVLYDANGEVFEEYQVEAIPATMIVTKEGKIIERHTGSIDFANKQLSEDIKKLAE